MNIETIKEMINELNLPVRKAKSKNTYSVYLLKHDLNLYYFGVTKDFIKRIKQHQTKKTIIEYNILYQCQSLSNAKIIEAYLTLHFKLKSDFNISNKRAENLIF